jgi:hypothetical protein
VFTTRSEISRHCTRPAPPSQHGREHQAGISRALPGGADGRTTEPRTRRRRRDVHPDAADPVRAGHRRERAAVAGVLLQAQGAPGGLLLPVQEEPADEALRQLPQRQEGVLRLQGSPAQVLSA